MLRMRNVQENAQALLLEGRMETVLTPTCSSVAPGGALLHDRWETIVNKLSLLPEGKPLLIQAHTLAHTADQSTNVHMLLQFLTRAARYVKRPLFEKLFSKVAQRVNMEWGVELPRRLTLKLPTYGKSIANWATNTLQTLFSESCVPPALKVWPRRTICVMPVAPRKIQGVVRKMRASPCARWIPTPLGDLPQATVQVSHSGLWVACSTSQLDAEEIFQLQNTVQLASARSALPLRHADGHVPPAAECHRAPCAPALRSSLFASPKTICSFFHGTCTHPDAT